MAKRSARLRRKSTASISPIHPALHYILFLVLALILVLIVGFMMQKTARDTRARLVCPQINEDPVKLVEELSRRCPDGVVRTRDANGCTVWVCKLPQPAQVPASKPSPVQKSVWPGYPSR